jgi:hypothetical protein
MGHRDIAAITPSFHVERWDAEQVEWVRERSIAPPGWEPDAAYFRRLGVRPYSVTHDYDCNMFLQAGYVALLGGIAGTSIVNKFSATFGRIGVGTSTTTATYADTHLTGDTGGSSTTSYYMTCGAVPTLVTSSSPPTMTFTASFATGVANFAWNEFGTDNYNTAGVTTQSLSNVIFINHGISPQGIKVSGQIWTATEVLTFGVPTGAGTVS